jgi:hypothetical protein
LQWYRLGWVSLLIWAHPFGFSSPAPEFFNGIETVRKHNAEGNPSYLLGKRSMTGFWNYYPVLLAIKTPLGFLILLSIGTVLCLRTSAPRS